MIDGLYDIEVIFENEELIAINKPHGLLVHRSRIANDSNVFALQLVRDKINKHVYPVHRIDRKTSGVLLFTKSKNSHQLIQKQFSERKVKKKYLAIVRGFLPSKGVIDYPLKHEEKTKKATTAYKVVQEFELEIPSGQFQTSRYSLLEIEPETGRYHQIRKHMAHILHPILGDRPHGCNKQNKLWKEKYGMTTMLLHAQQLRFYFPETNPINISASLSNEFQHTLDLLSKNDLSRINNKSVAK